MQPILVKRKSDPRLDIERANEYRRLVEDMHILGVSPDEVRAWFARFHDEANRVRVAGEMKSAARAVSARSDT